MSTSSELAASCYLSALKKLLKQRGITYGDLADALGCSLPTIKRSLNKTTLPLQRLLEIAEVANLRFQEICLHAEQLRPQHFIFSTEQDALFTSRPEILGYLTQLLSGKTPREIADEHELDANSSRLYQKHLQEVGLIKRKARNQVKLLVSPPVGFGPGSAYLKKEMQHFMTSVITDVVHAEESQPGRFAIMKPLKLTQSDYQDFVEGMKRLVDQYSAISERSGDDKSKAEWQVAIASGIRPASWSCGITKIDS